MQFFEIHDIKGFLIDGTHSRCGEEETLENYMACPQWLY